MKFTLTLAALLVLTASLVVAEQDITARLSATAIAYQTTNTTASQPAWGWEKGTELAIQGTVTGSNANSGNLDLTLDTSLDSVYWISGTHSVRLPTEGAATTTTLLSITNEDGSRWLRVGKIANTNAAGTNGGTIVINKLVVHPNK